MNDKPSVAPSPKSGWMKILLILSLGLNLLFVGLSAGAILRERPHERGHGEREISALGLRFYYRALEDGSKSALRSSLDAKRPRIRAGREHYRAHLASLAEAISAEPFSAARVQAVLDAQSRTVSNNIALGHELLLERIAAMSPEDRKAMAARLNAAARRADRRHD